jgi:hypothetical protein
MSGAASGTGATGEPVRFRVELTVGLARALREPLERVMLAAGGGAERWGLYAALFAATTVILASAARVRRALRGLARRAVASAAGRMIDELVRQSPCTVVVELQDAVLVTRLIAGEKSVGERRLVLAAARLAVVTPSGAAPALVCLFDGPRAQRPLRIIQVPGPDEQRALLEAFRAAGSELIQLELSGR